MGCKRRGALSKSGAELGRCALDDFDFLRRQVVKLVNQLVDLRVARIDLALEICLGVLAPGGGEFFVQFQDPLDQRDHSIVSIFVSFVGG